MNQTTTKELLLNKIRALTQEKARIETAYNLLMIRFKEERKNCIEAKSNLKASREVVDELLAEFNKACEEWRRKVETKDRLIELLKKRLDNINREFNNNNFRINPTTLQDVDELIKNNKVWKGGEI